MSATSMTASGRRATALLVSVAVLTALVAAVGGQPALACSCAQPGPSPEQELAAADAVFAGEVVDLVEVGDGPPGPWVHARMEVSQVWAGEVHEVVEVRTHAHGATCGHRFEEGRGELVYASVDDEGRFTTGACDRTGPLDRADEDLAALGAGDDPLAGDRVDVTGSGWGVPAGVVAALVAGLLAVGAAGGWALRRKEPGPAVRRGTRR